MKSSLWWRFGLSVLAAFSFWLGGLPVCIERAAWYAYTVAREGYEHGLFGVFGGTFVRGTMWAGPALVFFVAACIVLVLFRKTFAERVWPLCVLSGLLGLLCSGLFWHVWLRGV